MTPRDVRDVIAWTLEDHDIWCRVTWDGHLRSLREVAITGDRRDAALMLFAQQLPDQDMIRLGYFDQDVRVRMSPWMRWVDP